MHRSNNNTYKHESFNDIKERWMSRGPSLEKVDIRAAPEIQADVSSPQEEVEGVYKLKSFPNDVACLPNEWVRSGLFAASNKIAYDINPYSKEKRRRYVVEKPIPTFSENVSLIYTGYELNQFDQIVYLSAIMQSKQEYLTRIIRVTPYEFCEKSGIPRGGKSTKLVHDSLERLFSANLKSKLYKVVDGQKVLIRQYNKHMLHSFSVNQETDRWEISLNVELAVMYETQTTWIDWDSLLKIKGEIARGLALQVYSHEAHPNYPQRISLEKLKLLLQSNSSSRELRRIIKTNLNKLLEFGIVKTAKLENDVFTFTREN